MNIHYKNNGGTDNYEEIANNKKVKDLIVVDHVSLQGNYL